MFHIRPWKIKLITIATLLGMASTLVVFANQVQLAEPMWVATRSFVREQVTANHDFLKVQLKPIEQRQIEQDMMQTRILKDNTRDKLFDLKLMLDKADGLTPDLRNNIRKQVQDLEDRVKALDDRMLSLQNERVVH